MLLVESGAFYSLYTVSIKYPIALLDLILSYYGKVFSIICSGFRVSIGTVGDVTNTLLVHISVRIHLC